MLYEDRSKTCLAARDGGSQPLARRYLAGEIRGAAS